MRQFQVVDHGYFLYRIVQIFRIRSLLRAARVGAVLTFRGVRIDWNRSEFRYGSIRSLYIMTHTTTARQRQQHTRGNNIVAVFSVLRSDPKVSRWEHSVVEREWEVGESSAVKREGFGWKLFLRYWNWLWLREILKQGVNKSNHPIYNPLLLVTEPWTRDNILYFRLPMVYLWISPLIRMIYLLIL
jgi:hypothetical protein